LGLLASIHHRPVFHQSSPPSLFSFFLLHLFVEQLNNCGPVSLLLSILNHQIKKASQHYSQVSLV
jgi:hypothetical protein